jgi:hypothetical protein
VDVVPRFGLATVLQLRDDLGRLHHEGGLVERVAQRRREGEAAAATADAAAAATPTASAATASTTHPSTAAPTPAASPQSVASTTDARQHDAALQDARLAGASEPIADAPALPVAEDTLWARSILTWLREDEELYDASGGTVGAPPRPKLYPPGRVLWRPTASGPAEAGGAWLRADNAEFDSILLSGSQMLTAHVPHAYARAFEPLPLRTPLAHRP